MSRDSVVMKSGLLLDAIWMTAERAAGPGFRTEITDLLEAVARVKIDRSASFASMYCCQVSNPREHSSMASARCGEDSSLRYIVIDLDMSDNVL